MPFSAALRPTHEETRISGTLVDGNRRALRSIIGNERYREALATVEEARCRRVEEAIAVSWVAILDMEHVIMACADTAQRDVFELNREMTRVSTEQSFRTVWRALLRFTSDSMILSRTSAFYSRAYDRGRLVARLESAQRGECQIHGRPGMSRMTREAFGMGIETVLRIAGRQGVRVTATATEDGAHFALRLP